MKVKVDKDLCIGCSLCVQISGEFLQMDGDVAVAKEENVPESSQDDVKEAVSSCPTDAIIIVEE